MRLTLQFFEAHVSQYLGLSVRLLACLSVPVSFLRGLSDTSLHLLKSVLKYPSPPKEDNFKNEDNLKNEDDIKNGYDLKNEENLKNEGKLKNEDFLKNEDNLKTEDNLKDKDDNSHADDLKN